MGSDGDGCVTNKSEMDDTASNRPLDAPEFSAIDYINEMFPTEQSLTNLDDTIGDMRGKISGIDDNLRHIVRGHRAVTASPNDSDQGRNQAGVEDASLALAEAQSS